MISTKNEAQCIGILTLPQYLRTIIEFIFFCFYSDSKNSRCPGEEHRSHEVHAGPGQNARNPGHNERHVQRNDEGNNRIILYLALY